MKSNGLKIFSIFIGLLISVFAFQNCKNISLVDDGKGNLVVSFDDEDLDDGSVSIYNGNVLKMHYFHGGWFGIQGVPNFRANLELKVSSDKKSVAAKLLVPKDGIDPVNAQNMPEEDKVCTVNALLSLKDYSDLEKIIHDSEINKIESCKDNGPCAVMVDGGTDSISLFDKNDKSETYFLKDPQNGFARLVFKDDKKVRTKLDAIIAKLKENCGSVTSPKPVSSDLKLLHYTYDSGVGLTAEQAKNFNITSAKQYDLEIKYAENTTGHAMLILKGYEKVRTFTGASSSTNTRNYSTVYLPLNFIEKFNAISYLTPENICMAAMALGMKDHGTYELNYENKTVKGQTACWSNPLIKDNQQFIEAVKSHLSSL